jgi:uncharacterized DUF497 family protein
MWQSTPGIRVSSSQFLHTAIVIIPGTFHSSGKLAADKYPGQTRLVFLYIRIYIKCMDISFDTAKDARNIVLRGLSFARAVHFDWASALILEDTRREYGERRFQALGLIDDRLHMLVFSPRADTVHIISLRKANHREIRRLKKRQPNPELIDDEIPEWTAADFKRARPAAEVLPRLIGKQAAERLLKPHGRPKLPDAKVSISLRLPPETLARWKASGRD